MKNGPCWNIARLFSITRLWDGSKLQIGANLNDNDRILKWSMEDSKFQCKNKLYHIYENHKCLISQTWEDNGWFSRVSNNWIYLRLSINGSIPKSSILNHFRLGFSMKATIQLLGYPHLWKPWCLIHFWLVVWNMNFIFPYRNNDPNWLKIMWRVLGVQSWCRKHAKLASCIAIRDFGRQRESGKLTFIFFWGVAQPPINGNFRILKWRCWRGYSLT